MTRKSRINYLKAISHNVERKKMYKAKKQWIVAGMSFLVATGLGALSSHLTTHADANQITAQAQKRATPNSSASSGSTSATKSNVQSASNKLDVVQSKATNIYRGIMQNAANPSNQAKQKQLLSKSNGNNVNNSAKPETNSIFNQGTNNTTSADTTNSGSTQVSTESKISASNTKPNVNSKDLNTAPVNRKGPFNSAYQKYLDQMGNTDSKVANANDKSIQNNPVSIHKMKNVGDSAQGKSQPSDNHWIYNNAKYLSDGQTNGWQNSTSNYYGLSYKYNQNLQALEFTGGTMTWGNSYLQNSSGMPFIGLYFGSNIAPNNITANKLKSIKFDSDVDTSNVTNMSRMFEYDSALTNLNINSFNMSHINNVQPGVSISSNSDYPTGIDSMFKSDTSLRNLELPNTSYALISDMKSAFSNDTKLSLILPNSFDTQSAIKENNVNYDGNTNAAYDNGLYHILLNVPTVTITSPNTKFGTKAQISPMYQVYSNGTLASSIQNDFSKGNTGTFTAIVYSDIYSNIDGTTESDEPTTENFNKTKWAYVNTNGKPVTNPMMNSNHTKFMIAPVDDGLTYKFNKNKGSIEFCAGTPNNNLSNFSSNNSDIQNAKSITFDNDININADTVKNMNGMFNNATNLQSITIKSPNIKFTNDSGLPSMAQKYYNGTTSNQLNNFNNSNIGTFVKVLVDDGLIYEKNNNGDIEFVGGTPNNDLSNFSSNNSDVKNAKSITFDNDISINGVKNMNHMFSDATNLQNITIKSPNVKLSNSFKSVISIPVTQKEMLQQVPENYRDDFYNSVKYFSIFELNATSSDINYDNWLNYYTKLPSNLQNLSSIYYIYNNQIYESYTKNTLYYKQLNDKDSNGNYYTSSVPNDFTQGHVGTFVTTPNPKPDTIDYQYNGSTVGSQSFVSSLESGGSYSDVRINKSDASLPSGYHLLNSDNSGSANEYPLNGGSDDVPVAPNYEFSSASNALNAIRSASADETNANAVNSTVNNVYKKSLKAYNNSNDVSNEINTENGSYGQITSLNTQINSANNLAQSYITDARTDISNSNASATSSALSNAQSANKVASGYATQATRINNAMNSTNPTPSVYSFASATNTINGLSSASADETNADNIHNTMNGYMQSLNADTNSVAVSNENTTDSSAHVAISNLNTEMNAANQSASNDIAKVRTDINNSNASATKADLSNAQADNQNAKTDAQQIVQQANKMTDTNPTASEYGFSSASSVADKLSASANTSTADHIHTTVDNYMSSINADTNSASVSNEVSSDNSNYTKMTSLVSQLNNQNGKVQTDINAVNADAKEPSNQLNASQTIKDLNQAQTDNQTAQGIVSQINGYASLITDSTTPNVYSFASASSVASAIQNVPADSKDAYSISSTANTYASSASSLYVNASALNSQSTKDSTAYHFIMSLVNQVSSANNSASIYASEVISNAKLPMDSRNAASVIAELRNAQAYHNLAVSLNAQGSINGSLANMSDQITPINLSSANSEESRANSSASAAGSSYNDVEKDNTSAGTLVASASSFESNATKSYDSSAIASLSNLDNSYSNDVKSQSSLAYSASSSASSYAANVKNDYYSYDSYPQASSVADFHANSDSKGAYLESSLANQASSSAGSYLALMNSISAQMSEDVVLNNDSSEASSASAVTNAASSSASNDSKSASQSSTNAETENNSTSNNSINTSIASQISSQNSYDQSLSNQIVSDNNLKSVQSIKASSLSVEYKSISNNQKTANNASLKALLSNTASESNSYDAANSVLASDIRIDQSLSNNDTKANSSASKQISTTQANISAQNYSNSSLSTDINNDFNSANNDISSENSIANAMSTDIQNSYATSMSNNNSSDYNITNNASNMSNVDNTADQRALSASQAASIAKDKLADAKSSLAHMTTTNFNELLNAITQASYAKSMADLDYSNASYISYVASSYAKSSGTDLNGNDIQYQESMDNTFWTSLTSNSSYANYYSSLANSVSNQATQDTHAIQSNGANNSINQAYIDQEESVASNYAYLAASYMSNANGDYDLITDRTKPSTKQTVINNDINQIQLDSSSAANFNGGSDTYISGVISNDKQEINRASNSATQDSYVINMSDADKRKSIADSAFANASAEYIGYQDIASDHIDKAIGVGSLHLVYNIHQSDNNGPIVATRTKTIYIPIDKALNINPLTNSSLTISPWTYTKPYYDQHNNNWTISFNSNEFKGFNPNGQYNNLNYNPTSTFTYNATQAGPITVEYKDSDANLGSQTISDIHGLVGQTITLSTPEMGSTDKDIFGELNVPDGYHLANQLNTITLTKPSSKTINTPPKLRHAPVGMVLTVEIRRNKPTNNSASASVTPASASNVVSNETSSSQSTSVMPMITPTKIDTNTPQSNQSQSNTTSTDTSSNLADVLQKQGNSQLQQISSNAHHELKHMMHHNSAKFTPDNDVFYAKIHQLRASRTKLPRVWTVHQLNKVGRGHTVRFGRVIVTSLSGRHSYEFRILKHVYLHKKIYFTHGKFHSLKPSHKALRINRIFLVQQGKHTYIRLELRLNHHTYFITGKKHYVQGLHR